MEKYEVFIKNLLQNEHALFIYFSVTVNFISEPSK